MQAVLDGRNVWSQDAAEAAGLMYFGVGRTPRFEHEAVEGDDLGDRPAGGASAHGRLASAVRF